MNLIKKGVGYTVVASMLLTGTALPLNNAAASEVENSSVIKNVYTQQSETHNVLTNQEIQLLDPYVTYDLANKSYSISDEASEELGTELYNKLVNQIEFTNSQIQYLSLNNQVEQLTTDNAMFASKKAYVNGKDEIDWHWWGATIYISRNTMIAAAAGVSIGGLWIPQPILSKVIGSLGIAWGARASLTGGIKFEARWNTLTPAGMFNTVNSVSYQ